MKRILDSFKGTVVGGALFQGPVIVLLAILRKTHQVAVKIVTPFLTPVPVEALG